MKKLLTLFLATFLLSGALGVGKASALTFEVGEYNFLMSGYSYFGATEEGTELMGIFSVSRIENSIGNDYWTSGTEGKYLNVLFGGLSAAVPFDDSVIGSAGYFEGGYAQMWGSDESIDFSSIELPGDIGVNPPFPSITVPPADLLLDMTFNGETGEFDPFTFQAVVTRLATSTLSLQLSTVGYLDIEQASSSPYWNSIFNNDFFAGADFAINGIANYMGSVLSDPENPGSMLWDVYRSTDASVNANAVPEPGTILLLGAGLLGLAAGARRRN